MDSSATCTRIGAKTYLLLNTVLHVFILYSFLSVFFIFYISKIEREAFDDEFSTVVQVNMAKVLVNADQKLDGKVKTLLKGASPILTVLNNMYSKPSKDVETYNKWLFGMSFSVSVVLILTFITITGVLKMSCGTCIPLLHLIKENVLIFIIIGLAEFMFFSRIASKFVPVPPSLLINSMISRLKENL
jgi:hypothetical protein